MQNYVQSSKFSTTCYSITQVCPTGVFQLTHMAICPVSYDNSQMMSTNVYCTLKDVVALTCYIN